MQKVVIINHVAEQDSSLVSQEYEYPKLKRYLDEGFKIKEVHHSFPENNFYIVVVTFILEK